MPNILLEEMPYATEIASISGLSYTYTFKGGPENSESFFFFSEEWISKKWQENKFCIVTQRKCAESLN